MFRRSFLAYCAAAASVPLSEFYGKNFTVSPRTWQRIAEKNAEEGFTNDARFLRLAIDSGGCHGYQYKFSFDPVDTLDREEDLLVKATDVPDGDGSAQGSGPAPQVVVDKVSLTKLENAVLDYHSELKGSAFVVVGNELVDASCACALSFSLKKKTKPGPAAKAGSSSGGGNATASSSDAAFLQGSTRGGGTAIKRGK